MCYDIFMFFALQRQAFRGKALDTEDSISLSRRPCATVGSCDFVFILVKKDAESSNSKLKRFENFLLFDKQSCSKSVR